MQSLSTLLELVGLWVIVIAFWLVSPWLAALALGFSLVAIGYAIGDKK